MKKSQLRNIIRESIKELMTEQVNTSPNPNPCPPEGCRRVGVVFCGASGAADAQGLGNNITGGSLKFAHTGDNTQIGDILTVTAPQQVFNWGLDAFYASPNVVQAVVTQLLTNPTHTGQGDSFIPPSDKATWAPDPAGDPSNDPDCGGTGATPCDTTPASACATQWFQNPNANWAANWINNRDCSNYTWPANNLETQALQLMSNAPNPYTGTYNNASDIWAAANAAWPNTTGGPKGQFIGKMAKGKYSQCQKQACNC